MLTGKVNPSGHLPVTFLASESQLPRPARPGTDLKEGDMFSIEYSEGAAVGYKWFDAKGLQPLFPFGHGLSYTSFAYGPITASTAPDGKVSVRFLVRNTGKRRGMDVAQVYVSPAAGSWEAPKRLAGFKKVDLAPGASTTVNLEVDPRLLATYDEAGKAWRIAPGQYRLLLGESAAAIKSSTSVTLPVLSLPASWRPGAPVAPPAGSSTERG